MNLNNLYLMAGNFFHAHTFIALAIVAALAIIVYLRPKQSLKVALICLAALVIAYGLYLLEQTITTGLSEKEQLINK